MESSCIELGPHSQFLKALFAFKSKVSSVFNEVLGINGISHLAITRINSKHEILSFSSTPAIEFNLFTSGLWKFDNSYNPSWFKNCAQSNWEELYAHRRFDELYYLKQIKPQYPLGYSLALKRDEIFFVYSLASKHQNLRNNFENNFSDCYKLGDFCNERLEHLFMECYQEIDLNSCPQL